MSSNDPFEDRLRQVLLAEAQTVTPAGDGLSQIRAEVARRRNRLRWLRPGLAVVTAGALAGAAVLATSLTDSAERTLKQDRQPAGQRNGPANPSLQGSIGASAPPPQVVPYTIWPYTSPPVPSNPPVTYHDPSNTALAFLRFLQAPEVDTVLTNTVETTSAGVGRAVTLGRKMADGKVRAVTVVHLVRLGTGSGAPYAVTRAAGAYTLKITAPGLAAPVRSRLTVKGTIDGVHQSVRVELRTPAAKTPISTPASAPGSATAGWSTPLSFTTAASGGVGTLVARTDSDAGDGALQITAQPVLLPAGGTAPTVTPVAKPAADGDIDGDGRTDAVTVTASANGRATVSAQLTRLGRQSLPVEATAAAGLPGVMGVLDVDGDGYAEVFVKVGQGASTGSASIVRLVSGRLAVVTTAGSQAIFYYGGSVTHLDTLGCGELDSASRGGELFTWGGTSSDGMNYIGTLTVYRFDGANLAELRRSARNTSSTTPAPAGCGSLRLR